MTAMKTLPCLIVLGCSLALVGLSQAQKPLTNSAESPNRAKNTKSENDRGIGEASEAQTDLRLVREAAQNMIRQAAEEAARLDDRRCAARIQGAAANAIWSSDRDHARILFRRAFAAATDYYRKRTDSRPAASRGLSLSPPDIRVEIINLVNRRDGLLGGQLMEKYAEEKQREFEEKRGLPAGSFDPAFGKVDIAASDYLKIAESLLDVDEKAALGFAQRSFASGIPQAAGYFFSQLAARNRSAADQMYRMAIDRLGQDNAPVPGQLLLLSAYPFGDKQVWVAGGAGVNSYRFEVPKDFTINVQQVQSFITVAYAVLTRTAGLDLSQFADATTRLGSALFAARLLEPKIAQFQPALLPEWHAVTVRLLQSAGDKSRDVDQALDEVAKAQETAPSPDAKERIQQLLARAERTSDPVKRDDLYRQAAFDADKLGDRSWALEIADEITDVDYRKSVRSALHFDAAIRSLKQKRFDEAHRLALQVDKVDQQTYLLLELARSAGREKNRANMFLEEAEQHATAAPKTTERLRALLGIAHAYAGFDSVRSFEIAGEAVRTANKAPAYDSDEARLVRMTQSRSGHSFALDVTPVESFDLAKTLALLAGTDFHRSLGLAELLENDPERLASVVSVCASVIAKEDATKAH